MAVREFTGSDEIQCAIGAMAPSTYGTFAVIAKRGATGAWDTFLALHTVVGTAQNQFAFSSADAIALWVSDETNNGPAWNNTTDWVLIVVRKATGTANPRYSVYNFTTDAWTHADGSGDTTIVDWGITTGGVIRMTWEGFDHFTGRIAIRAGWSNSLGPSDAWTADASGDSAIEAAGLQTSAANWLSASPSFQNRFNQDATTTDVTDDTGNGADQTSISGTSVVTGDDPPGFDFSLSGTTGSLAETQADQTLSASGTLGHSGSLAETQADQTLSTSGTLGLTGSLAETQADQSLSASGTLGLTGSLAETQAEQTLSASGTVTGAGATGSLSETQDDQTATIAGWVEATGTVAQTQADQTLSATGTTVHTGTLAVTQVDHTLSASGSTFVPTADPNPFRLSFREPGGISYRERAGVILQEAFAISYQEPA